MVVLEHLCQCAVSAALGISLLLLDEASYVVRYLLHELMDFLDLEDLGFVE